MALFKELVNIFHEIPWQNGGPTWRNEHGDVSDQNGITRLLSTATNCYGLFHHVPSPRRQPKGSAAEGARTPPDAPGEQLPRRQPLYVTPDASGTKSNVREFGNSAKLESSFWDWSGWFTGST